VPLLDLDIGDEYLLADALPLQEPPTPDELSETVAAALDALPVAFREALWLLEVEELRISEAAEVLEVPVGTVASRAHRARQKLRALLEGAGKGGR
jgi:RNA polymerase sigma-70 factor (ECF subfamily)